MDYIIRIYLIYIFIFLNTEETGDLSKHNLCFMLTHIYNFVMFCLVSFNFYCFFSSDEIK